MTTTQQSRMMAHAFNEACRYHVSYTTWGMQSVYAERQRLIAQVATLTGQSFNYVLWLVEVATTDQSPELYPASWVGLRTAEEIEAEWRKENAA